MNSYISETIVSNASSAYAGNTEKLKYEHFHSQLGFLETLISLGKKPIILILEIIFSNLLNIAFTFSIILSQFNVLRLETKHWSR